MSESLEWLNLVLQGRLAETFIGEWRRELERTGEPISKVLFARVLIEASLKKRINQTKYISVPKNCNNHFIRSRVL